MSENIPKTGSAQTWLEFVANKPNFPSLTHRWMLLLNNLAIKTPANEHDHVGHLIMSAIVMSCLDINDIMTLSYHDSSIGAHKLLRSLYERIVTIKYISEHPEQADRYIEFDSIDTQKIMDAIRAKSGIEMEEKPKKNLELAAELARKRYKQKSCPTCKAQKPISWTSMNSKDMADHVGLGHMYFYAFLVATKQIHPTYWGAKALLSSSSTFSTLNSTHELIVQLVLIHRRHFAKAFGVTPMMNRAINDFLAAWTISEGSFDGLLSKTYTSSADDKPVYYG